MLASFIITFRETLEAALIVGIVLSYFSKIKQEKYNNIVYVGVVAGVVASVVGALIFNQVIGGFEGPAENLFEGITMFIGAVLLTTMILWMMKQKHVAKELEEKLDAEIAETHKFGLFSVVFISVFREGVETVIFLSAASFASGDNNIYGALLGIAGAVLLGYAIFVGSAKINLKKFFNITNILLILFAAGLVAHGVHEFEEAKILPETIEHLWDINPSLINGAFPAWHENGSIGSILKGLFGYNGDPSLLEVISYLGYLVLVFILYKNIEKVHKVI